MEKVTSNNSNTTENTYEKMREHEIAKEKLLLEEKENKRKETHEKFVCIKEALNENINIQKTINNVIHELKFNIKDFSKLKYLHYFLFSILVTFFVFAAVWKLHVIGEKINNFFQIIVSAFILVSLIEIFIVNHIIKEKIYKKYIKNCKDKSIVNEHIIKLINIILDNNIKIANMIPKKFFTYFTKEYNNNSIDMYIGFICNNNKNLLKKYKDKDLRVYRKIHSRNMELLIDIEEIENSYFQSKLDAPVEDTIERCVEKFLHYN